MALTGSEFSETQANMVLHGVACAGAEPNLLNCSHSAEAGAECGARQDAGLVCQCKSCTAEQCGVCVTWCRHAAGHCCMQH